MQANFTGSCDLLIIRGPGEVFFLAHQTGVGQSLWRSDGSADGMRMIKVISPATALHPVSPGVWLDGRFYFLTRTDIIHTTPYDSAPYWTYAFWTSDGTPDGTREVSQLTTSLKSPYVPWPVVLNGALYFMFHEMGWSNQNGVFELWWSDGTSAGTGVMFQGAFEPYYDRPDLVVYGGSLYFPAWDAEHGQELWRSDGTAQGTGLFADLNSTYFMVNGMVRTCGAAMGRMPLASTGMRRALF